MPSFSSITKFVYGTTRLGDAKLAAEQRVKIAREAMNAGVWFHTSHQYGDALQILRTAFDQDRARVPKMIFKIGWNSVEEIRTQIKLHLDALAIDHMDIGQLCLGGDLAADYGKGGKCLDGFRKLKSDGLVRELVVEVFPWTSENPLKALRAGHNKGVIDGHIFYLNPLQRFASNELWDLIQQRNEPVIAMRTVSGGDVHALAKKAWKPYVEERARRVAPLFDRSGCKSWTEFCVRYAFGFPQVRATVGSTSRLENLREFLDAVKSIEPLPPDVRQEIVQLQREWSDAVDVHAEPWSM